MPTVLHILSSNTLEVYIRSKLAVGYWGQGQILPLQTWNWKTLFISIMELEFKIAVADFLHILLSFSIIHNLLAKNLNFKMASWRWDGNEINPGFTIGIKLLLDCDYYYLIILYNHYYCLPLLLHGYGINCCLRSCLVILADYIEMTSLEVRAFRLNCISKL